MEEVVRDPKVFLAAVAYLHRGRKRATTAGGACASSTDSSHSEGRVVYGAYFDYQCRTDKSRAAPLWFSHAIDLAAM
jgi:hypothetical protein